VKLGSCGGGGNLTFAAFEVGILKTGRGDVNLCIENKRDRGYNQTNVKCFVKTMLSY